MKSLILKLIRKFINNIIGINNIKKLIIFISKVANINLTLLAYNNIGILNYHNELESGELFFIKSILVNNFKNLDNPIIFDVGANIGTYSKLISNYLPKSKVFAFEPNNHSFSKLKELKLTNVNAYNLGFGLNHEIKEIYTYTNELESSHASMHKEVFMDMHKTNNITSIEFHVTTLDSFCKINDIKRINFLKIDTEGNEFAVLQGATNMIKSNLIDIIQFEFNEMNIISRVFLRDFYKILDNYNIYRLSSNSLIPILDYNSTNEIFKFQNIIAVNKKMDFYY